MKIKYSFFRTHKKNMAMLLYSLLSLTLFFCANTNSCTLVYQIKAPKELERFKKL